MLTNISPRPKANLAQFDHQPGVVFIYFLEEVGGVLPFIKVGQTKSNLTGRIQEAQTKVRNNGKIKVVAIVRGQVGDEGAVHKYWRVHAADEPEHFRQRGNIEWFNGAPEIYAYLEWLVQRTYVATSVEAAQRLPLCLNSPAWLPADDMKRGLPDQKDGFVNEYNTSDPKWLSKHREKESPEYFVSETIIDAVNHFWHPQGGIHLDPCSCDLANNGYPGYSGIHAKRIITRKQNGLKSPWGVAPTVWLNPPYKSGGIAGEFFMKALKELRLGNIDEMLIYALPSVIDAAYAREIKLISSAKFEPNKKYMDSGEIANRRSTTIARFLYYIGPNYERLKYVFQTELQLGKVWTDPSCKNFRSLIGRTIT